MKFLEFEPEITFSVQAIKLFHHGDGRSSFNGISFIASTDFLRESVRDLLMVENSKHLNHLPALRFVTFDQAHVKFKNKNDKLIWILRP